MAETMLRRLARTAAKKITMKVEMTPRQKEMARLRGVKFVRSSSPSPASAKLLMSATIPKVTKMPATSPTTAAPRS